MRLSLVGIIVGVLMAGTVRAQDALVIRDGTRRQGVVAGCRDDACTLDGARVARGLIAWVGLRQGGAATPRARDPLKDEVHLVEGRVVTGEFGGLSLGAVAIGDESFDRDEVAWIRFAGPEPAAAPRPSPAGPNYRFSPSPPAASPPGPSPPPTPPPPGPPRPPEPRRPPGPSTPPGSPSCDARLGQVRGSGVMWTGSAWMVQSMRGPGYVHTDTADFEIKLRESCETPLFDRSVTPHRRIGTLIAFDAGGTVQRDTRREEQTGSCLCEGQRTDTKPAGDGGTIWRRTGAGNTTSILGFDLPSQPSYYLNISNTAGIIEAPCRGQYCVGIASRSPLLLHAGRHPSQSTDSSWDPELRSPEGGIMRGSYTKALGPATLEVSWSICRQGVRCPPPPELSGGGGAPPPPPPPPPEEDSCGDLAGDRAQVDVLWEQRQAYAGELEAEWNALEQAHGEMLDNVEAYRAAIDACAIWDIVSETLESASGWAGEFTEFGTKVLSGDLSAFVGEEPWKSLSERAWDVFPRQSTWAGLMHDRITGCSAPISPDLRTAALRFVDSWERVRGLMPAVQQKLNRIRTQDQKYWDQWNTYYRDCLEYARCKGLPPSTCPPPPASPSGPMPR